MKKILFIDGLFENGSNTEVINSSLFSKKYHIDYFFYETKSIISLTSLSNSFTLFYSKVIKKNKIDAFVCFSFGSVVIAYSKIPKNTPIVLFGPSVPHGEKLSSFTTNDPVNPDFVIYDNGGDEEILNKKFVKNLDKLDGPKYAKLIHNPIYVIFHNTDSESQKKYNQDFFNAISSKKKKFAYVDIGHEINDKSLSVIDLYLNLNA